MNEREQIINYLLQACDAKSRVIEELQAKLAAYEKAKAAEAPAEPPRA